MPPGLVSWAVRPLTDACPPRTTPALVLFAVRNTLIVGLLCTDSQDATLHCVTSENKPRKEGKNGVDDGRKEERDG